jgi:hypothetical protein
VLFTLTLPFTGLQPVWDTGYSTTLLLVLAIINLFLVNGVFQEGHQGSVYPVALKRLVNASLLCLPVLVGLAAYASWMRIDQYGLTPSRILALLLVGVMLAHGLAAAWAVLASRQGWLNSLRVSNPWIALLSAALVVLFYTPLLAPQALSAKNQVERLVSGRTPVSEFDARNLYHDLGQPGRDAFEQLENGCKRMSCSMRRARATAGGAGGSARRQWPRSAGQNWSGWGRCSPALKPWLTRPWPKASAAVRVLPVGGRPGWRRPQRSADDSAAHLCIAPVRAHLGQPGMAGSGEFERQHGQPGRGGQGHSRRGGEAGHAALQDLEHRRAGADAGLQAVTGAGLTAWGPMLSGQRA